MSIYGNPVMMGGGSSDIVPKTITQNGVYNASSDNADGYNPVTVNVPSGEILSGRGIPDPSLGSDGDVYRRRFTIPSGINFVEYLESGTSGGPYINTGIYATQDIDAIVTIDRQSGNANSGVALGVRTGSFSSMSKTLYFGSHTDNSGGLSVIKTGSSNSGTVVYLPGVSTRRTQTIRDKSGAYVYWSTIDESSTYSKLYRQTGAWQSDMPLCMFAFYQGTTLQAHPNSTRIIRVTILEKGVPIADYLPCLDGNGVACMWENVGEQYVYNTGTGDFLYGSSATPAKLDDVYYVKNNGAWEAIV